MLQNNGAISPEYTPSEVSWRFLAQIQLYNIWVYNMRRHLLAWKLYFFHDLSYFPFFSKTKA
jgi:hypothetical protein